MNQALAVTLPLLMLHAITWAERCATEIANTGTALGHFGLSLAQRVGVQQAALIRVKIVETLPLPEHPVLRLAAIHTGLIGEGIVGLTLGYGIYICHGHESAELVSHECRHVHQYEQAGSIANYLPVYLQQIVEYGYKAAPYEMDARAHELSA